MACGVCADLAQLVQLAAHGAGAALLTEEVLTGDEDESVLLRWVAAQPPWSDLPFVVLAAARSDLAQGDRTPAWLDRIGNVVLLERPLGAGALASALHAALRGRRRQYEVRAHLIERELAAARLEEAERLVGDAVSERTESERCPDRLAEEAHERELTVPARAVATHGSTGPARWRHCPRLQQLLQAVIGGLHLIQRRSVDPDAVKLAHMTEEAAQRGASITGAAGVCATGRAAGGAGAA